MKFIDVDFFFSFSSLFSMLVRGWKGMRTPLLIVDMACDGTIRVVGGFQRIMSSCPNFSQMQMQMQMLGSLRDHILTSF